MRREDLWSPRTQDKKLNSRGININVKIVGYILFMHDSALEHRVN